MKSEIQSGLTFRSFIGLVYTSIIMMPAIVFSSLVSGITLGAFGFPVIGYVTAFLFEELARSYGKPLTKQEIFIIWGGVFFATENTFFVLINQAYFRSLAPITWSFKTSKGTALPLAIPDWWSPPPSSPVFLQRTFLSEAWISPLLVLIIVAIFASRLLEPALGFLTYQLYVVEEKLPFPAQVVSAETVVTLAERQTARVRILTISAIAAASYAVALYFMPYVFGTQILPVPWIDLTYYIERNFPGASFGIATDPINLAIGLMLPLNIVLCMFIGSLAVFTVGNHLLVAQGVVPEWRPGLDLSMIYQLSTLHFWTFVSIGLVIAIALVPFFRHPRVLVDAFKSLSRSREGGNETELSLRTILLMFLAGGIGMTVLASYLTSFPWYIIAVLIIPGSFMLSLLRARSLGVSGFGLDLPYLNAAVYTLSGYQGVDVWFAPITTTGGGGWWCSWFKICDLTQTTKLSFYKTIWAIAPISVLVSLVYTQLFWSVAPIPSSMYPAVSIFWPIQVINKSLWITGGVQVGSAPILILGSLIAGIILEIVSGFINIFSFVSLVVGMSTPIPTVFTVMMGGIAGRIVSMRLGDKSWKDIRSVVAAGIFLGESLIIVLAVALNMVSKAMWILPY